MRAIAILLATTVLVSTLPAPVAAVAPYADAGLDQTVTKHTTVHVDATGSTDPDGAITDYQWRITAPDGTTSPPDCATCGETTFRPAQTGRYAATVTITDDDGNTASDTLYVDVKPGAPPTLTLTGPTRLHAGQTGTYVAEATAGDALLAHEYWSVDGTPTTHRPLAGTTDTHQIDRHFTTPGTHTITVKITDADGQHATRTIRVTVTDPPASPPPGSTTDQAPNPTRPENTGTRGTAAIDGPTLITGTEPLNATYRLDATHVRHATWWKDGARIGTGETLTTTFTPGDHSVHALVTYTDNTTDVARFPGGTTRVTADPEPEIAVSKLTGVGSLNTDATATDGYGNLQQLELRLDDTPLITRETPRLELRNTDAGNTLSIDTPLHGIEPGVYEATLTATDARGQRTTTRRTVEVVGPPELVRSEFATQGDLDVYHPRIDPGRYTALHVVEIKLNGADPDSIKVVNVAEKGVRQVENEHCSRRQHSDSDTLFIVSCWANSKLSNMDVVKSVFWKTDGRLIGKERESIITTPSDPEIRIRVVDEGVGKRGLQWGMVVDAADSFDPDGGSLDFEWRGGAVPVNSNGSLGKMNSMKEAGLIVRDDNGGESYLRQTIPVHFNPRIKRIREVSEGPYLPSENVEFAVATRPYELAKANYREDVTLELELQGPGRVTNHVRYTGEFSGDTKNRSYEPYLTEGPHNYDQQFWTVEVPAKAFVSGDPAFEVFNVHSRQETNDRYRLPHPTVLQQESPRLPLSAVSTRYVVEVPTYTEETTTFESRKETIEGRGFTVVGSQPSGTEWRFERRELVSPAVFETSLQEFDSRGRLATFLELNPEWRADGSRTVVDQVSRVRSEWRSSHGGEGQFTGRTREVQTRPNRYVVENQYRYEYTDSVERTRTKTKTYEYPAEVDYTVEVEKCNEYIGCYDATVTRTKTVTKTATKEYTETYQSTVRRTATYWSTGKRHHTHTFTGRSSRELIQRAAYETQYEYEVEYTDRIEKRVYVANWTRQVEPPVYQWTPYKTTRSRLVADQLETTANIRLADTQPVTEWTLRKQTGVTRQTFDSYSNESRVTETRATVSGELSIPYVDPDSGTIERIVYKDVHSEFTHTGFIDRDKAIEIYLNKWARGRD